VHYLLIKLPELRQELKQELKDLGQRVAALEGPQRRQGKGQKAKGKNK
jgi:hypothetical protein